MFEKAKNEQSAVKALLYGMQGAGKTLTALDIADGLSKQFGGRIAMIATERGYDFYTQKSNRKLHPAPFDFDVFNTRSFLDAKKALGEFERSKNHSVLIIDSLTQIYEAAKNLYGQKTKHGNIMIHTWQRIKSEYDMFIENAINCPKHIIFCGRSANLYERDDSNNGESVIAGTQPRVGKDTGHEAHIVIRMEQHMKNGSYTISAQVEKDRTSVINGAEIMWPSYSNTIKRILPSLGSTTVGIRTDLKKDIAEEMENDNISESSGLVKKYENEILSAQTMDELREIIEKIKGDMDKLTQRDLDILRSLKERRQDGIRSAESPI